MDWENYIPIEGLINFVPKAAEKQSERVRGEMEILEFATGELVMVNYKMERDEESVRYCCFGPLKQLNHHLLVGGRYYTEGCLSTHLVIKRSQRTRGTYEYEFQETPCFWDSRMGEQVLKPDAKFLELLLAELETSSQPFAKSWQEVKKELWKLK